MDTENILARLAENLSVRRAFGAPRLRRSALAAYPAFDARRIKTFDVSRSALNVSRLSRVRPSTR